MGVGAGISTINSMVQMRKKDGGHLWTGLLWVVDVVKVSGE
jgi:hypothetical protein